MFATELVLVLFVALALTALAGAVGFRRRPLAWFSGFFVALWSIRFVIRSVVPQIGIPALDSPLLVIAASGACMGGLLFLLATRR